MPQTPSSARADAPEHDRITHTQAIYGADFLGDVCKPEKASAVRKQAPRARECILPHPPLLFCCPCPPQTQTRQAAFDKVLAALPPRAHRGETERRDGAPPHDNCVFFEDSFKNLVAGKAMGMRTVLIRASRVAVGWCRRVVSSVVFFDRTHASLPTKSHDTESETVEEEGRSAADFHLVDAVVPRLSLPLIKAALPFLWEDGEREDGNAAAAATSGNGR